MNEKYNLINQKFGRLTVICETGKRIAGGRVWLCQCDCGMFTEVQGGHLKTGNTESCGCLQKEALQKGRSVHDDSGTRLHQIWHNMISRCENPNTKNYRWYGGRGIRVCLKWRKSYIAFKVWALSNSYADNLTIDRVENDGNYEPGNCQFLTKSENSKKRWLAKTYQHKR